MKYLFIAAWALLLGCANPSLQQNADQKRQVRLVTPILYIVPFDRVMVPQEVAAELFNRFVDRLNQAGKGRDFVILKQGLEQIDPAWLAERDYLVGEIYAYVEDVGSSVTAIKARSRIRLFQPGEQAATLELTGPAESFFENDYATLASERQKLAEKISRTLADQLLQSLSAD